MIPIPHHKGCMELEVYVYIYNSVLIKCAHTVQPWTVFNHTTAVSGAVWCENRGRINLAPTPRFPAPFLQTAAATGSATERASEGTPYLRAFVNATGSF